VTAESTKEQARPERSQEGDEERTEGRPTPGPYQEPDTEPAAAAPRRARWAQRIRDAGVGASALGAASTGLRLVARLVTLVTGILAAIIVLTILFKVLEANRDNSIVTAAFDVSDKLVGPLDDVFTLKDRKAEVAVNYGLAALAYLVAGNVVARVLRRLAA
jgi:hypothetical protein